MSVTNTPSDGLEQRSIHVGAAQIFSNRGPEHTLERMDVLCRMAALLGVEALLFSEAVAQGYDPDMTAESVRAQAEPLDGPIAREIAAIAARHRMAVLAGILEREGESVYNSQLIAEPCRRLRVQRKHALTRTERQARLSAGPRDRLLFDINGVRCAVLICADAGIEGLPEELHARGVQLRFLAAGGGGRISDMLYAKDIETPQGRRRYEENRPRVCIGTAFDPAFETWGSACVSANGLGPAGAEACHQGHCVIVDAQGVLRAQAPGTNILEHMHEQLIHAVLTWPLPASRMGPSRQRAMKIC